MATVKDVLERYKSSQNAYNKSTKLTPTGALQKYKRYLKDNSSTAIKGIYDSLNAEYKYATELGMPSWGKGSYEKAGEAVKKNQETVAKLKGELDIYKDYIDKDTYDSFSKSIASLETEYSTYLNNANIMQYFDSEDIYKQWYERESFIKDYVADPDKAMADYKYQPEWLSAAKSKKIEQDAKNDPEYKMYAQQGINIQNPNPNDAPIVSGIGAYDINSGVGGMLRWDGVKNKATYAYVARKNGNKRVLMDTEYARYAMMTEDEVLKYSYYLAKYGEDKAEEYFDSIAPKINERLSGIYTKAVDDIGAAINSFTQTVNPSAPDATDSLKALYGFASGMKQYANGMVNFFNDEDYYDTDAVTLAGEKMKETLSTPYQIGYDMFSTVGNMFPSLMLSAIPVVGGAVSMASIGMSAAGNARAEMINAGYSDAEAGTYALIIGVLEAALQKALGGIKFGKGNGGIFQNLASKVLPKLNRAAYRVATEIGANVLDEALEEGLQSVLEPLVKKAVTGDWDGIDWEEVGYSAMLGGLTGGLIEGSQTGVSTGLSSMNASNEFSTVESQKGLVSDALAVSPDSTHAKWAQSKLDKGKSLSGYQLNRLATDTQEAIRTGDAKKISDSVKKRLLELGEGISFDSVTGKASINEVADAITKSLMGESLTVAEKRALNNSKNAYRVMTEADPGNVASGNLANKWAENIGTTKYNAGEYNIGTLKSAVAAALKEDEENTSATAEASAEAKTEASENVTIVKDGKEVEVKPQRIASLENGEMTIELEGGTVVNANEVDFGEGVGLVYQAARDMASRVGGFGTDTANLFVKGYNPESKLTPAEYVVGWTAAYNLGKEGTPVSSLTTNAKTSKLTDQQRTQAYNLGKAFGKEKIVSTVTKKGENISKIASEKKKGKVIFEDSVDKRKLKGDMKKVSVKGLEVLAAGLGINIHLYASEVVDGKHTGENGWYDPKDNSIHIDVFAGVDGEGIMLFTASHELTHHIREILPEKFKVLADAIIQEYTNKYGKNVVTHLIENKIDFLKEKGRITEDMTEEQAYDLAFEEVIADCCETILTDSNALEALSESIHAKDKTLWEKIKSFFADLVARIKAIYKNAEPDSAEGLLMRELGDNAERIFKLWSEAIVEASEVELAGGTGAVKYSYSSIAYSFFGDKTVQVKDFENGSYTKTEGYKKYVDQCLNNMRQTSESFDEASARKEIEDSIAGIVNVAVAMKKAGYDILDNQAKRSTVDSKNRLLFSSLEPNSDYFTSSDISTICDKRINFAEIYDEIVRREEALGVPNDKRFFKNVDNYFILHKIMADKGLTQPCRQCYVESMRKNLAPMANAFLKLMQETDPNNKANDQLWSKGQPKPNNTKLRENLLEAIATEGYEITADKLTVEMLTTEDGLAQLKLQAPLIYEAFNSFYGQSKPKMPKSATPFRFGELTALLTDNNGKIKKSLVEKILSTGGFRLQSYSDFQIQNFADVLQVIFEAGTLGLNGHAYTKVPAFLDATKGTNLKRNISIFMYNDDGAWKIDRNDSFPYDLDKIYDIVNSDKQGNTTIIAVSQNEMMAAWVMANDNIGYFIPFHKSGMKMGTVRETVVKEGGREIKGYSGIKDHTRQQTEVWAKTTADHKANTKVKNGINIYEFWDFDNADNLSREGLIEKNVRAYIDACIEAGYLPKFREYVMNNSKVLNSVLAYSKQLGLVSQDATIDDISFEYKGYRIPYGYYKCLGDFGMFTPDGEASPIERLSLKDYNFDEAVKFFSNAETLRRNEILQQIANGVERENYRNSDMTTAEIAEEVQSKRNAVVDEVVSGEYRKVKHSGRTSEKSSYSYDTLTSKDEMEVKTLPKLPEAEIKKYQNDTNLFAKDMRNIAARANNPKNTSTKTYLHCRDLGADVLITRDSFKHGAARMDAAYIAVCKNIADVLNNSVVVNELLPRGNTDGGYILLGLVEAEDSYIIVRSIVNKRTWKLEEYQELDAIKKKSIKKEDVGLKPPHYIQKNGYDTSSVISIADFLEFVNTQNLANSILSLDVIDKLGSSRGFDENVTPNLKYSSRADKKASYSDIDSLGNELSKEQQEFFKDSKVRDKKGNLMVLYHGTTANFNTFKKGDVGFHFGTKGAARGRVGFSKNVVLKEVYLNITNPIVFDEDLGSWDADYRLTRELYDRGILTQAEAESVLLSDDKSYRRTTEAANKKLALLLVEKGYDGIEYSNTFETKNPTASYIVFNSNQAKEIINKAPTSNPDIRYQDRGGNTMRTREILANALESVTENDIEKQKLALYKEKIGLMTAQEEKLKSLNAEIKELSFAEGKRDTARIKELRAEAVKTENRINTYDKSLLNLESTTALKNLLAREKAKLRKDLNKRAAQSRKEALARAKEAAERREAALKADYQAAKTRGIESRNKTAMRHRIISVVGDLNKLLLHESKERNIKAGLKAAVALALEAVNLDTVSADARIAKLEEELLKAGAAQNLDKVTEIQHKIDYVRKLGDSMKDKLTALKSAYEEIASSSDSSNQFKEEAALINTKVQSTIEKVGDTPLRDMTLSQLEAVHDLYKMVLTTVRDANKIWRQGKQEDLQQYAKSIEDEIAKLGKSPAEVTAIREWFRKFKWNEMIPYYFFENIGSETLAKLFYDFIDAQNTYAVDLDEAHYFALKTRKKHGYNKWQLDKVYSFKLNDGRIFETTLKHLLSIYAYSKRDQALDHMSVGGFFHNDKATFRKKGGVFELVRTDTEGYRVDAKTLFEIQNALTDEQKAYVEEMQDYLTKMGEKGNEVTRVLWGIDLFKEKVYFPLKSKDDFLKKSNETAQAVALKNDGMTKEVKPGASNPIVLEAFDDVWASHVNRMSQYHAFVLPIDNMNKVSQYGTWANNEASSTVSTKIKGVYGTAATDYLQQFIKDINGNVVAQGVTNPIAGMFNKFKKTAVAASLSVIIQQPTAIARAIAEIDPKYFVGNPTFSWDEIRKYAPIAIIKDIGGFDAGSGVRAEKWLNEGTETGISKVTSAIDEYAMKGAEMADRLGWGNIWNAVKRETAHNNPLLNTNSEEFLKLCGKRFTEVIVKTQVYDSTLSRSAFMRSKHDIVKMLTSFMGEPTVAINMLYNGVVTMVRGRSKAAIAKGARMIAAVYLASVLGAAFKSLISALNDDDEDESYWEKYMQALGNNVLGEVVLLPASSLPVFRDVVSIIQGYDVERGDLSVFKDVYDAFSSLSSDSKGTYKKVEDLAGSIAALFGIPAKNLLRTGRQFYNLGKTIFDDISGGNLGKSFIEGFTNEKRGVSEKIYDAILDGDDARLDVLLEGKSQSEIALAYRKALRENDSRIKEAAEAKAGGNFERYESIALSIELEGHFDRDDIKAAITSEFNELTKADTPSDESVDKDETVSWYNTADIHVAFEKGDNALAKEIIADIINAKVANGKTEKEAKSSIMRSMTSYWKPLYIAAHDSKNSEEKARIKNILIDSGFYGGEYAVDEILRDWIKN